MHHRCSGSRLSSAPLLTGCCGAAGASHSQAIGPRQQAALYSAVVQSRQAELPGAVSPVVAVHHKEVGHLRCQGSLRRHQQSDRQHLGLLAAKLRSRAESSGPVSERQRMGTASSCKMGYGVPVALPAAQCCSVQTYSIHDCNGVQPFAVQWQVWAWWTVAKQFVAGQGRAGHGGLWQSSLWQGRAG